MISFFPPPATVGFLPLWLEEEGAWVVLAPHEGEEAPYEEEEAALVVVATEEEDAWVAVAT